MNLPALILIATLASPPKIVRDGHTLFLNGQGIHTASIFQVKVYDISLYLEKRSQDPQAVLASQTRKVVFLKFRREVSAEQLRSAFLNGFHDNCRLQCELLRVYLDQLNAQVPNLREGDSL